MHSIVISSKAHPIRLLAAVRSKTMLFGVVFMSYFVLPSSLLTVLI